MLKGLKGRALGPAAMGGRVSDLGDSRTEYGGDKSDHFAKT